MMGNKRLKQKRGSILVISLWSLGLLSIFAANMGFGIRQKITLLSRLEQRSQLHHVTAAGIKKARAILQKDIGENNFQYTQNGKASRHNNPQALATISMDAGSCAVSYPVSDDLVSGIKERFGVIDEESKININTADQSTLLRLIQEVTFLDETGIEDLATAIVDWRQVGTSETTGFYSDDYYGRLEYPYETKDAAFERIEELLLLKGMNSTLYAQLFPYVTTYGNGQVNINTASSVVLKAIGFSPDLIRKILLVRRGPDGVEATRDDFIFRQTYDIASDLDRTVLLEAEDINKIDELNQTGKLTVSSYYFLILSKGVLKHSKDEKTILCVYNAMEDKIAYWREQ